MSSTFELEEQNIGALVEKAAALYHNQTVLYIDHEGVSYYFWELNEMANRFANALREAGIRKGQHVGVMLPNCSEFPFTWLALAKLGAVMVPINTRYRVMDLEYILNDSDTTALIIHTDYIPVFRKISPQSHRVDQVFRVGMGEEEIGVPLAKLASEMPTEFTPTHPALDDVMNLQYTSGTTGFPKAAITTHRYWLTLGKFAAGLITGGDVFLTMSPFYYMDPQWELLASLYAGSTLVMAGKITLENFSQCVRKYSVTCFWAFSELLYLPEFNKESKQHCLRLALLGAFPPELHKEFEERFQVVARVVYGSTEVGIGTLVDIADAHMVGSGSVGKPPAIRKLRIVDEEDHDVPQGEVGELLVKGPGLLLGYYKKPEANASSFLGEYFRTGDLFRQDQHGYYYFIGRKKEMIRRLGDNISATEIEHVLISHPKIAEAAVVPVPDEVRGEEVKAYIHPASGETPKSIPPEEIIDYCLEKIAKFKVPRYIEYVEQFPRSTSNKIQKNVLVGAKKDLTDGCYDRFGDQK